MRLVESPLWHSCCRLTYTAVASRVVVWTHRFLAAYEQRVLFGKDVPPRGQVKRKRVGSDRALPRPCDDPGVGTGSVKRVLQTINHTRVAGAAPVPHTLLALATSRPPPELPQLTPTIPSAAARAYMFRRAGMSSPSRLLWCCGGVGSRCLARPVGGSNACGS